MQYNKQLFIGDYWIFSYIYQLVLPGSLLVSIRFGVLLLLLYRYFISLYPLIAGI